MLSNGMLQIVFYVVVLLLFIQPLGWYMAQVYSGKPCGLSRFLKHPEHFLYRLCGIDSTQEMNWKEYLYAMLWLNVLGTVVVYACQRLQAFFPFNPQHFSSVSPELALNTAASFVTNTDWQAYGGESTMSYCTQMLALTVQNFLSAATGMSLLVAFIRGLVRFQEKTLGNFWVDVTRSVLYILLPLSLILAVGLVSQGVIQNMEPYQTVELIQPITYESPIQDAKENSPKIETKIITQQVLPMGPVASQVAIKQIGTNGGGFFNTNSAHPFENPTPLSNFLEMLAILLVPAALCHTFGVMVRDKRQGYAVFVAMFFMLIPAMGMEIFSEEMGNPAILDGNTHASNMEGKEVRFGVVNSALWATLTTATSNGSVNAMHDSLTPLGGLFPLWVMHLGEIVFGGIGSGLYGMLLVVIITVFLTGLMVGRTPEYLGKKIEPYEMKMASIAVLLMPMVVLLLTATAVILPEGKSAIANPGAHGFTEILYAFTSMGANNGSAFAGLNANTSFYNVLGGIEMLVLRFWLAIPALAVAGSLVQKKIIPTSVGTLPTHTPLFVTMIIAVTLILGALTFFPALVLGPIVEHIMLWR